MRLLDFLLDTEDRRAIAQFFLIVLTLSFMLVILAAAAGLAVAVFQGVRAI